MGLFGKKKDGTKKKFADTKVGQFLKERAPDILEAVGDMIPGGKLVTALIKNHPKLTDEEKGQALELLKLDIEFEKEITARWLADAASGQWLAANARPLVLLSSVLMLFVFITLDSCGINFEVKESWISLYEVVLVTAIGGYFGLRSWEKRTAAKNKTGG